MITSPTNSHIKAICEYMSKTKERRKNDIFVVEGIRMNEESPFELVREVYASDSFMKGAGEREKKFLSEVTKAGKSFEIVSDAVYDRMTGTRTPQGILSVVKQIHYEMKDILKEPSPLIIVLEDIQDPGNLGTILRTAEGAGVSGIIMSRKTADIYNPKVVRSTMGSIFRIPFVYADAVPETMKELKAHGIELFAAYLKGTKSYDELNYTKGTAFLIGNEGNGLSKEVADSADTYIRIPMLGRVESLNAATSTAILAFEAARQRRQK